jgi:hypothetical protein
MDVDSCDLGGSGSRVHRRKIIENSKVLDSWTERNFELLWLRFKEFAIEVQECDFFNTAKLCYSLRSKESKCCEIRTLFPSIKCAVILQSFSTVTGTVIVVQP